MRIDSGAQYNKFTLLSSQLRKIRPLSDSETFGFLVTDVARMTRALLERRIAAAGLGVTPGEARALLHVVALKAGRQIQIAERMGVEPMTACAYIDKLEKQGLVMREADPDDRRAKQVRATEAARPLIDALQAETAAMRADILTGLTPQEYETTMAALRLARANLQELHAPEAEAPQS
jgi:DNA-binding MarR family transcriptional regulator